MKKTRAKARADELTHDFGADALEEAILRAHEAADARQTAEAQTWLSAVFALVRKGRGDAG
jgi:hypothetical protein